jgi:hypothetical protein
MSKVGSGRRTEAGKAAILEMGHDLGNFIACITAIILSAKL